MKYLKVDEISKKWDMPIRKITRLCREGRLSGAIKKDGIWLIPNDLKAPSDLRKKINKEEINDIKLPLPIGESDFKNVSKYYYYIDKTLLIKDLIDKMPKVSLFTRPRRFGKTLTMSMIKTFFDVNEINNADYFKNFKIWNEGNKYKNELGKYPVFFITFKDVKKATWQQAFKSIRRMISLECQNFIYLLESEKCNDYEKRFFKQLLEEQINEEDLQDAFIIISLMLKKHHNIPCIIIIDEYDTPIQEGYNLGYYDDVITFMRNFLSGAFKDNSNLKFGFLTGILQVAKESIFSGLNNLSIHSVFEESFSEYFGFTHKEVLELLKYYNAQDKYDEIKNWYDGYLFGDTKIFNPWSVINYFYNNLVAKPYWKSTGENSIIRQIVFESNNEVKKQLVDLLQGESIKTFIDNSVVYPNIKDNPTAIYSFLLAAGYLNICSKNEYGLASVKIPNKEISLVYEQEILQSISKYLSPSIAINIQDAIIKEDFNMFEKIIEDLLLNTISSFDYSQEGFYQGLSIGLCAILNDRYKIESNIETGYGRCDISLTPLNSNLSGIIIEVKSSKESTDSELLKLAHDAVVQINNKLYYNKMKNDGVKKIFKIGIAFCKKKVKLVSKIEL